MRDMLQRLFLDAGYEAFSAADGPSGLRAAGEREHDLVILDMSLPKMSGLEVLRQLKEQRQDLPVIMITAYGSAQTAVEALRLGAYDYITKPFDLDEVQVLARRALQQQRVLDENRYLRNELKKRYGFDNIVGVCLDVQRAYVMAAQVAGSNATVLLLGETGTGKEYLARTIHYQSDRAGEPFLKVNCAALSETLLESELFGHEKGAFTHAVTRHIGRFEAAHSGTIFLDEIGEMSPALQTKFLRVLQEKQFERVGGSETLTVDVRVIAATNCDLDQALREKRFREDLYYRLNVVTIKLPPIRERGDDIEVFAAHFLDIYANEAGKPVKRFSKEATAELLSHDWPGNIRELENAVERAVILCNGETIRPEHLMLGGPRAASPARQEPHPPEEFGDVPVDASLRDVEFFHIRRVLEHTQWNQSAAAQVLGIDRKTLRNKIREFRLER